MIDNIEVFTQNSICVTAGGRRIYIDPYGVTEKTGDADIVFLTHDHYDHFSPEDIEKIRKDGTKFVFPVKMGKKLDKAIGAGGTLAVEPGKSYELDGISFETVAAYNILKPFHPKFDGWVGYILDIDGCRIYIAGDTDATSEAKTVKCDIALVPIGGTYTMDAKAAAELINKISPEYAVPTHYGSIVGSPSDGKAFEEKVKAPVKVVHKLSF